MPARVQEIASTVICEQPSKGTCQPQYQGCGHQSGQSRWDYLEHE